MKCSPCDRGGGKESRQKRGSESKCQSPLRVVCTCVSICQHPRFPPCSP